MAKTKKKTKEERINEEEMRLREIYKNIEENSKNLFDGLIPRAAFLRITLEDLEADLNKQGFVEQFTQSEKTDPYERERPSARQYNQLTKNYQNAIKQLDSKLPKVDFQSSQDDGFDSFVSGRND